MKKALVDFIGAGFIGWSLKPIQKGLSILQKGKSFGGCNCWQLSECVFLPVTDDQLLCGLTFPIFPMPSPYTATAALPRVDVTGLGLGFCCGRPATKKLKKKKHEKLSQWQAAMCWDLWSCEPEVKNSPFLLWLNNYELQWDFCSCSLSLAGDCFLWYNTIAVFSAVCYIWQECEW